LRDVFEDIEVQIEEVSVAAEVQVVTDYHWVEAISSTGAQESL
jgi:hypothetical protein